MKWGDRVEECSNCIFYITIRSDPKPQCVRFPPTHTLTFLEVPLPDNPANTQLHKHTTYPAPDPDWWCGEWKPKREFGES